MDKQINITTGILLILLTIGLVVVTYLLLTMYSGIHEHVAAIFFAMSSVASLMMGIDTLRGK